MEADLESPLVLVVLAMGSDLDCIKNSFKAVRNLAQMR